jgi:sirohydrochlorin ferrochelatase
MAHGGTPEWNAAVAEALASLPEDTPRALAYGMANPYTLQAALDSLTEVGVERVAVVRLFLSGQSFLHQTRYFLGLEPTAPEEFVLMGPAAADPAALAPVDHDLTVATHHQGLMDAPEATRILAERATSLSRDPAGEAVLFLAHGMGDEAENAEVLVAMASAVDELRTHGFADVRAATLREDWAEARVEAEASIRSWAALQTEEGRRALVVPMRLSGFGPYADVLEGFEYVPGEALLPHPAIGDWIRRTADAVSCGAGWGAVVADCPSAALVEPGS